MLILKVIGIERMVMTRRVGFEINGEKSEYLHVARTRLDVTPLDVEGMRFKIVT